MSQAEAAAKADARNKQVMQGSGCVAEAASSCAGLPVSRKLPPSQAEQETAIKLAVSMTVPGRAVVTAIDAVTVLDGINKGNYSDAATTGSSMVIGEAAQNVAEKTVSKTTAGRIGAVIGSAWESFVNFFKSD